MAGCLHSLGKFGARDFDASLFGNFHREKSVNPSFYHVANIGRGFLAVMAKPVPEWIDDEIRGLSSAGFRVVTSLLERSEAYELGLANELECCQRHQLQFISFPIADRGVPENVRKFGALTNQLFDLVSEGSSVVIHCRAGIGRSGLLAAGVLLHTGLNVEQAFQRVSVARGVTVPDTPQQVLWLAQNQGPVVKNVSNGQHGR